MSQALKQQKNIDVKIQKERKSQFWKKVKDAKDQSCKKEK